MHPLRQVFYSTVPGVPLRNVRITTTAAFIDHVQTITALTAGSPYSIIIGTDDTDVPGAGVPDETTSRPLSPPPPFLSQVSFPYLWIRLARPTLVLQAVSS